MGQLSEPSNPAAQQAAVAELATASNAIASQDAGAAGNRSDTSATQVSGSSRGLEFNPANEPAGSSGLAPGAAVAGAQPAAAASGVASEYEGALDYARGRGLDVSRFADDGQLMDALVERYHRSGQEDHYAQLGRMLAPQAPQIQQYLQQQKQPQASAPPEWEAPAFDERWAGMVDRDPLTGIYVGKPGVPPEITQAVNKFADYQKKFTANPIAMVKPYVEQTLPGMINQLVEQRISAFQREQAVNSIVEQNAGWMYDTDANGRVKMGVAGRPVPTPQGMRYMNHVQYLEQQGVTNPAVVDRLARQLTAGEVHSAQLQQHQAANPTPAQQQQAIASGRAQQNVLQSLTPQQAAFTPGATTVDRSGMSLHEQLKMDLDAAGFQDSDFQDLDSLR